MYLTSSRLQPECYRRLLGSSERFGKTNDSLSRDLSPPSAVPPPPADGSAMPGGGGCAEEASGLEESNGVRVETVLSVGDSGGDGGDGVRYRGRAEGRERNLLGRATACIQCIQIHVHVYTI